MFIDTHCHLAGNYCDVSDLGTLIIRAQDAGVGALICPCADPKDIGEVIKIIDQYDNVFSTIGVHPEYANTDININTLMPDSMFNHPKIVGIGEIGLDYHYGSDNKNQQIELFEQQLVLAKKHNMPVAIHTRDAEDDTKTILDGTICGVMHCFTGSWDLTKTMLDRGFYFSASGILTFKNAVDLRETFAKIPNDRIVIETDAPYCTPVPYRGTQCEPSMVIETAKVLSQIKNLQLDELESILEQNTKNLYPKCNVKL